ncbi:MAG: TolB family protein [Fimbriimonadales bacterium]
MSFRDDPMTNASFRQLYVINPDGTEFKRLTDHWGDDYGPQWTLDSKFIVIQSDRGMRRFMGGVTGEPRSELIVVDAKGGGERVIDCGVPVYETALSPR